MKKAAAVITFILVPLLLATVGTIFVNTAFAQMGPAMNPGPDYSPLSITVISPKNYVYNSTIELKITVTKPASWFTSGAVIWNYGCQGKVVSVLYSIDGQPSVSIPVNDTNFGISEVPFPATTTYNFPLPEGLSQGLHTISVSVEGQYYYWTSDYTYNTVWGNSSKTQFYFNNDQYVWGGSVSPPEDAAPPIITIFSPNSTVVTSDNVPLSFKAKISRGTSVLIDVWYQVAWQPNKTLVTHLNNTASITFFNDTLAGMSDGNYMVTVFANGAGGFVKEGPYYVYEIVGSSSVNFTVDSILPTISFSTTQNSTFDTGKVVLDFAVNKPVSQIIYSLDNSRNVTANVNASLILNSLSNGEHNVTIYAVDEYGIISPPSMIYFNIKVFPTITALAFVLVVLVVIMVVAGLLVYHKKHQSSLVKKV
jgi:hypothetical protein